jgi:NADPH:quinone reductase
MRGVECVEIGSPDKVLTLNNNLIEPVVKSNNDVKIKVMCVGLNFGSDVLMVLGQYQVKPKLPFIPGAEISGIITEIGSGVKNLSIGDKVCALVGTNGFAEFVVTHSSKVIKVPKKMSFEEAASFMICYGTTHMGLKIRANLQKNEFLLIHGASGGVGLSAIQIGKALGAIVIATASTEEKLQICKENGADFVINYKTEDFVSKVKEITKGKGVNVVYDPVGGETFDKTLKCIAWGARIIIIGFASGKIPKIPANILLVKNCDIIGLYWGSYFQMNPKVAIQGIFELFSFYNEGLIRPYIGKTYALQETAKAMTDMLERNSVGKSIIYVHDEIKSKI